MSTPDSQDFTAAIVQMRSTRNVAANLTAAGDLVRAAAKAGAIYIQTPENTALMESETEIVRLEAQEMDGGSIMAFFRALARELSVFLHIGSFACREGRAKKLSNRSVLISPQGRIIAWYDKIHLFDVDLGDGQSYRESATFAAGRQAVVARLPFAALGLSVCYDLRFPSLYRVLAKSGAELLAVPAAFTATTGRAHWQVLLRARAIENGAFVLAAAQGGTHESGRRTFGHSMIVAPWGEVLAEAGDEPGILTAKIDLRAVADARRQIPALTHDRPFEITTFDPAEDSA